MSNNKILSRDINSSFSLDKLVQFLSSDNYRVREAAAKAIGEKKQRETIPILFEALKTEKTGRVIYRISKALEQFGSLDEASVDFLLDKTQKIKFTWGIGDLILNSAKDNTISKILTLFEGRPRNQNSLLYILSEIGDPTALELLYKKGWTHFSQFTDEESLSFHEKKLSSADTNTRIQAVWGLSNFQTPKAINCLVQAAQDKHSRVKNIAIEILGGIHEPEITDLLISILQNDNRKTTRVEAIKALTAHKSTKAKESIQTAIQAELDQSGVGDPGDSFLIQEMIKAKNPIVVEYLQKSNLLYSQDSTEKDILATHIQMLSSPVQETRELAISKIAKFKTDQAAKSLMNAVGDKNNKVRIAAINALSNIKEPDVTDFLLELIKNDPQASIRAAAISSIRWHGDLDVIPIIASKHGVEEPSVRQESANALGGYGGDKTVKRTARGVYHFNLTEYEDALKCFNQALKIDTKNPLALYYRGFTYSKIDKNEEALKDLDKYLKLYPHDPYQNGYYVRAKTKQSQHDNPTIAINDLKKAFDLHPKSNLSYMDLMGVYLINNQIDEGIDHGHKLINLWPDDNIGYSYRAKFYAEKGDYFKAIKDYSKSIELYPSEFEYSKRAECYLRVGFIEAALQDMDKAVELSDGPLKQIERAEMKLQIGDYTEVLTDCNELIEWDKECRSFRRKIVGPQIVQLSGLQIRGMCYIKLGELDKAQEDVNLQLKEFPEDVIGLFSQACIDTLRGDNVSALTHLRMALERHKDNEILHPMAFIDLRKDKLAFCNEIASNSTLDDLREDPDYINLIAKYCNQMSLGD